LHLLHSQTVMKLCMKANIRTTKYFHIFVENVGFFDEFEFKSDRAEHFYSC